jgi:hypothetical protein
VGKWLHMFRHSAGSLLYSVTGDLKKTQEQLGHADIQTTAKAAAQDAIKLWFIPVRQHCRELDQTLLTKHQLLIPKPVAAQCANNCLEGTHSRFQQKRASALLRPSRELSDIGGRGLFFPALRSIQFGNPVSAQFKNSALDTVALVLAGA